MLLLFLGGGRMREGGSFINFIYLKESSICLGDQLRGVVGLQRER